MHLAKIEIFGFKSFGQEVHIELPAGVTALVGPNGGGKSNVVDAIRWALGEQRVKELRAERWDDLLFAGNSQRRAARLAEVSLHFDNQDGAMSGWPEMVTVTRRLYRHGESEYIINGRSVRLRDVMDLFLDSGIGRFNYAIISQGRVEAALMQKPKDRLEQLEEAAGVSRYKVRKIETVSHLKDVQSNLARLQDLQQEAGKQMDEVRMAADQERQYLEWQATRTQWQERVKVTEYLRDQVRLVELRGHETQGTATLSDMTLEIGSLESHIEGIKTQEQNLTAAIEGHDQRLRESENEARQLDQKLGEHRLRLEVAGREVKRLESESLDLKKQQDLLTQESENLNIVILEDEETRLQAEHHALALQVDISREVVTALEAKKSDHDRRMAEATARHAELGRALSRWQGAMGVNSIEDLAQARHYQQEELLRLEREVQTLTHELEGLLEKRTTLRQSMAREERDLAPSRQRRAQGDARLRALRQLDADGEGLPGGVRAVMKAHKEHRLEGIRGTAGALIESDPAVTLAIQIGLGGSQNDVIVNHEVEARQAVKFLQTNALGRATFLPLDTIRPSQVPANDRSLAGQAGVVGWALDLVRFDQAIWPAVSHVLGRVLVLTTLDDAMQIGRQHHFRYKMVTLDGQLVHAGGAITGGQHGGRDPRLARRMEIETLAIRVAEESAEIGKREDAMAVHQEELRGLEPLLDELREKLSERRQQWSAARQLETQQLELADPRALHQEFLALRGIITAEESQRDLVETSRVQAVAELDRLQTDLRERYEHLRDVHAKRREQQILVDRMEQERRGVQTRIDRLHQLIADAGHAIDEHTAEVQRLSVRREEWLRTVEQRRRELGEARKAWDRMKQEALSAENRLRALQHEERRLSAKLAQSQQAIFRIEHQWESYVPGTQTTSLSAAEEATARKTIRDLGELMGEMDQIVPGSLMLFEQLKERSDYLENQMHDIEAAREDLLQTLSELDAEVDRRVEVTVSRVEKSFAEACRILYAGGEGGISFVADVERGLELWVKPPGKRPAHLSLLSGGEKALGGIAWLFALLAVRPSPFVILDEVEASLDEANALRFAEYLGEFRRSAQCVIVTHHKETMAVADALWGVAGDGQGQSRLVSVMLEETLVR